MIRGGEDGTLDMDDDDEDDLEGYDEVLHDGQFSDSDEELVHEPRYARAADTVRRADAFGDMGAELGEDDSDLDSEITDDAEDELLGYGHADDDVLNDTDDDF